MTDIVERLQSRQMRRAWNATGQPVQEMIVQDPLCAEAAEEIKRLRRALHEIAEEWAGAECGEPVYAQEAYAIHLARSMYSLAAEALGMEKS